jgi:sec-independent protein translocase protein TatA
MGSFSIWHWLVVGILVLLLFGRGRFSEMMGDVAKGIKSFKKGMSEDDEPAPSRRLSEEKKLDPPLEGSRTPEVGESSER